MIGSVLGTIGSLVLDIVVHDEEAREAAKMAVVSATAAATAAVDGGTSLAAAAVTVAAHASRFATKDAAAQAVIQASATVAKTAVTAGAGAADSVSAAAAPAGGAASAADAAPGRVVAGVEAAAEVVAGAAVGAAAGAVVASESGSTSDILTGATSGAQLGGRGASVAAARVGAMTAGAAGAAATTGREPDDVRRDAIAQALGQASAVGDAGLSAAAPSVAAAQGDPASIRREGILSLGKTAAGLAAGAAMATEGRGYRERMALLRAVRTGAAAVPAGLDVDASLTAASTVGASAVEAIFGVAAARREDLASPDETADDRRQRDRLRSEAARARHIQQLFENTATFVRRGPRYFA